MNREARISRRTRETDIQIELTLDGTGRGEIATGIGFFDHMLELFTLHGLFDIMLTAKGDIHVDAHHTVEDTGIVLGQAFTKALGDKIGIRRYGCAYLPMDETLARVVVDLGGRPYLAYQGPEHPDSLVPGFTFQLVEEFLRALSVRAAMNLHVAILAGRDPHHMAEAIFKGLGRALDQASSIDPRMPGVPSTKGIIEA